MTGAAVLGRALGQRLRLKPALVGSVQAPLAATWDIELEAARPALRNLQRRLDDVMSRALRPLTTLGRCACALATLPVVARHRPDALVIWFDAHADSNTPETSRTGYLGGMVLTGASGVWDSGLGANFDFGNVILVAARDIDPFEQDLIDRGRLRAVPAGANLAERLQAAIAGRPVYVHIDCDVLEPEIVPTEYAVAGGLDLVQLNAAALTLSGSEVVGLEIAEFEDRWPDGRPAASEPLIAALQPLLTSMIAG